jgi:hypothetical protein
MKTTFSFRHGRLYRRRIEFFFGDEERCYGSCVICRDGGGRIARRRSDPKSTVL